MGGWIELWVGLGLGGSFEVVDGGGYGFCNDDMAIYLVLEIL
jgi:hypothetical protein